MTWQAEVAALLFVGLPFAVAIIGVVACLVISMMGLVREMWREFVNDR